MPAPTLASLAKRIDSLERNVRELAGLNAAQTTLLDQLSVEAIKNASAVVELQRAVTHHARQIAG
jgi:hypothetical protein